MHIIVTQTGVDARSIKLTDFISQCSILILQYVVNSIHITTGAAARSYCVHVVSYLLVPIVVLQTVYTGNYLLWAR